MLLNCTNLALIPAVPTDEAPKIDNNIDSSPISTNSPQSPDGIKETSFSVPTQTTVDVESAIYELEEEIPILV